MKQRGFASFNDALTAAHAPAHEADLAPTTAVRQRLAYDELLANQLALMLIRAQLKGIRGRSIAGDGKLLDNLGTSTGSRVVQLYNGRAQISLLLTGEAAMASVSSDGLKTVFLSVPNAK